MWAQKSANEPSASVCHIGCSPLRGVASWEPFLLPSIEGKSAMGFQNADLEQAKHGLKGKDSMHVYFFFCRTTFAVLWILCYGSFSNAVNTQVDM